MADTWEEVARRGDAVFGEVLVGFTGSDHRGGPAICRAVFCHGAHVYRYEVARPDRESALARVRQVVGRICASADLSEGELAALLGSSAGKEPAGLLDRKEPADGEA